MPDTTTSSTADGNRHTDPGSPWVPHALIALLLLAYLLLFGYQAWSVGITFDEPAHLIASYMYWRGEDILTPATTPTVQHLLSGWAPLLLDTPLFRDLPAWEHNDMYRISEVILPRLEASDAHRLIFFARLPFVVFPLGIAYIVWRWGCELFGNRTGSYLAVASLLEPNLFAHASLIKSDVAAAFGLLWISYACWRFWQKPYSASLAHLALAAAIGAQTKFTVLPMIAVAFGTAALRYVVLRRWKLAVGAPILVLLVTYATLIAAYQFEASRPDSHLFHDLYDREAWQPSEIDFIQQFVILPVPRQFASGVRYIWNHGMHGGQPAYLLGEAIETPEPLYFPLALAVKYPIPLQILLVAGLAAWGVRVWRRQTDAVDFFIWAPALLVVGMALPAKILVGFRYILPCLPFLILGGGFMFSESPSFAKRKSVVAKIAATLLLGWLFAGTARIYPQGISYFNEWAGGPENGWEYLADSNIDWGQNLPELAEYARRHKLTKVHYAYFGKGVPEHHDFGSAALEPIPTPYWGPGVDEYAYTPTPGFYAISVNMILGFYWPPEYQAYFRYFREREPVAKAGYSIFLYDVRPP